MVQRWIDLVKPNRLFEFLVTVHEFTFHFRHRGPVCDVCPRDGEGAVPALDRVVNKLENTDKLRSLPGKYMATESSFFVAPRAALQPPCPKLTLSTWDHDVPGGKGTSMCLRSRSTVPTMSVGATPDPNKLTSSVVFSYTRSNFVNILPLSHHHATVLGTRSVRDKLAEISSPQPPPCDSPRACRPR